MPSFSNRLKELRKSKGVTQKVVAEQIGIIEQAYQKYEYGKHEPNHETTVKLANYFGVSLDYLLGRVDYLVDADGRVVVKKPTNEADDVLTPEDLEDIRIADEEFARGEFVQDDEINWK
jgi:transcriptional regulator with XRE-family HTH domain